MAGGPSTPVLTAAVARIVHRIAADAQRANDVSR
jgi:hypothetical protein